MLLICHEHYITIMVISFVVQLQKQCSTDHDTAFGGVFLLLCSVYLIHANVQIFKKKKR